MTTNKNTGLDNCRFANLDNYRFVNIDERYGDEVPVEIQDYMRFNPDGHFFEWLDGIYEQIDGVGVKIAAVRLPCLGEGELPAVSRYFAEAVIIGCIEGGATNCWARVLAYRPEKLTATLQMIPDELEDCIRSGELEEGSTGRYRVTIETIQRGVELILSGETDVPLETVRMYARDWYIDMDSVEADMILQVGLFGKVIFG